MTDAHTPPVFLGRQPILGREQQLLAYELSFRCGFIATRDRAEVLDPARVAAIVGALNDASTQQALGPYRCYLGVDRESLFSDLIEALPPQLVTLEILASVEPSMEVITRCRQLRELGFALAVHDVTRNDHAAPLLEFANIIKVDVAHDSPEYADALRARMPKLKAYGKKLLAGNVDTPEQMALCRNLGFDLFQGYHFAQPAVVVGKQLKPAQLALMRLLALVLEDAETSAIENAFKLEPGLTINLLRLTNSVGSGLSTLVTSLRHAITILGRRQLQRWLQLLIYTNPKDGASAGVNPLLQLAATRGRLMELLAERLAERLTPRSREFADQAFMVGIMSLMPALLSMQLADILDQLPVAPRVKTALTDFAGQHGQLLRLVMATEQTDPGAPEMARACLPGITGDFLETSLAKALAWANQLGEERDHANE